MERCGREGFVTVVRRDSDGQAWCLGKSRGGGLGKAKGPERLQHQTLVASDQPSTRAHSPLKPSGELEESHLASFSPGLAREERPGPQEERQKCEPIGVYAGPAQGRSSEGLCGPNTAKGVRDLEVGSAQKSHETESLISPSLLLGENPGHPSQQLQVSRSQDQEPLGSPSPSEVGSEYLTSFHTPEQPLATEGLAQQGEVGPGHTAAWSPRQGLFLGELAPPSGFFPYYRSQEVHLSCSTHQDCWCLGTRDGFPGSGAQDGCCKSALAGPDLLSGFSPSPAGCRFLGGLTCDGQQSLRLSRDIVLGKSGFVPYYRSPEETLHTSPVPSSSVPGSSRD
ncbi:LOW QUALITY PROTEIN: uncharacterized protein LOC101831148 [Mesocricetus auratus]|uniref:LOW QUALITY PROTEIN: uncharacterized protein LOC101831148 n=1 Tax=Mesocricetus auratus TaxID=10036 RepID=A0ABM2YAW0_MESAU|nr:LOW QUALITY PROTEIN: uncharacterized protein LOC101831148 [Mesocricetus auratus]